MKVFFPIAAPSLAAFWIALAFLSANASLDLEYWRVLGYAAALSAVASGVLLLTGRLFRPAAHPSCAFAAGAMIIASFQYDQVGSMLRQAEIHSVRLQMGLWALGMLVFVAAAAWLARFAAGRLSLMIGLASMFAVALAQVALNAAFVANAPAAAIVQSSSGTAPIDAAQKQIGPPVISLVIDTYARADVLADMFNVDIGGFEQALEQRGFVVVDEAMSNYPWTSLSMSSALDMEYKAVEGERQPYDSLALAYVANGINQTVSRFRTLGYAYAIFHAGRYRTTIDCSGVEDFCLQCGGLIDEMELVLLEMTPLAHLLRKVAPTFYVSLGGGDCPIEQLPEKLRQLGNGNFFLFGHHMGLHNAMNVDDECRPLDRPVPVDWPSVRHSDEMRLQVACLNRQTLSLIDQTLAAYADPIILISGDHGVWSKGYAASEPEALWRRHAIFTAIRLPKACRETVPADLTPVNHYRLIIACLSGHSPNLLPNRFFSTEQINPGAPRPLISVKAIDPKAPAR